MLDLCFNPLGPSQLTRMLECGRSHGEFEGLGYESFCYIKNMFDLCFNPLGPSRLTRMLGCVVDLMESLKGLATKVFVI